MSPEPLQVLALLAAAATTGGLAVLAWRYRHVTPESGGFAVLMGAGAVWSMTAAAQRLAASESETLLFVRLSYIGIVVVPLGWLSFAARVSGRGKWLEHRAAPLFLVIPLLTLAFVFSDGGEGPFWARQQGLQWGKGPWFWVHALYSYACLGVGSLLLLVRAVRGLAVHRRQAAALLAGLLAPLVVNVIYVLGPPRLGNDPTPIAIAVSGVLFSWAVFRWRLLDLVPAARDALVEEMADGVLVFDVDRRVVDLNPAARRALAVNEKEDCVGRDVADLLPDWCRTLSALRAGELSDAGNEEQRNGRTYVVRLTRIEGSRGRPSGGLIVLSDITARTKVDAELRAQRDLFEKLLAVARAVSEQPTLQATLQSTIEVATALTGADSASLIVLDEGGEVPERPLVAGAASLKLYKDDFARMVIRDGLAGWVARHREAALVADTREDERWKPIPGSEDVRSTLAVPVCAGSQLVGVLTLVHAQAGHFTPAHKDLMRAAADQMALTLRNAQIFDARTRLADRQMLLYEVLRSVSTPGDLREAVERALKTIAERTPWPSLGIALPDEERQEWQLVDYTPDAFGDGRMPMSAGIVGRAHSTQRSVLVRDVREDPDYVDLVSAVRSELAVPIRHGDKSLGVLNLESEHRDAFSTEDVRLAESIADALGLAFANANLYRDLAGEHERLLAAEKLRDDMTHAMVHDLRSPLVTVSGALGLLETEVSGGSAPDPKLVGMAKAAALRMTDLVNGILNVSRLESGKVHVDPVLTGLQPLVADALDGQRPTARAKQIDLESLVPDDAKVVADVSLVGRILQNLIGNAVKFTPPGGRVRVAARLGPRSDEQVIEVSDTGPGISPEFGPRVFEKFAAAGPDKGSGLGLAFCRLAVEAQAGRIWVETEPGQGSTFKFTLPAKAAGSGERV